VTGHQCLKRFQCLIIERNVIIILYMIEVIEYFQKGVVYRIRNKKTKRCLALCSKLDLKAIEEEDSCDQLWIIREIKNGDYEIEQLRVGSVITFH